MPKDRYFIDELKSHQLAPAQVINYASVIYNQTITWDDVGEFALWEDNLRNMPVDVLENFLITANFTTKMISEISEKHHGMKAFLTPERLERIESYNKYFLNVKAINSFIDANDDDEIVAHIAAFKIWATKPIIDKINEYIKSDSAAHQLTQYMIDNKKLILSLAAREGDIPLVEFLLKNGTDIDGRPDDYRAITSPLIEAVWNNKTEMVEYLLQNGANPNIHESDDDSDTPLMIASKENNLKIAELLIAAGADVNKDGLPLAFAVEGGYIDMVKLLLDNKADVSKGHRDFDIPLINALNSGPSDDTDLEDDYGKIFKLLLSKSPITDINKVLLYVAKHKNQTIIKYLLDNHYPDLNRVSLDGNTPLIICAKLNDVELIEYHIGKGALVDLANQDGDTPLICAAMAGNVEAVECLLKNGASPDLYNKDEITPLAAAIEIQNVNIVSLLLNKNANVNFSRTFTRARPNVQIPFDVDKDFDIGYAMGKNSPSLKGATVLMLAAKINNTLIMKLLLDAGAKIDTTDYLGFSALHYAAYNGTPVMGLIGRGATVDSRDSAGCTPLSYAILKGYEQTAKNLLENNADVNCTLSVDNYQATPQNNGYSLNLQFSRQITGHMDKDGWDSMGSSKQLTGFPAIMMAALQGNMPLVKLLLHYKADVNKYNNHGFTTLMALSSCLPSEFNINIFELLLKNGALVNAVAKNTTRTTALIEAVKRKNDPAVRFLLDHKAAVNQKDANGDTALMHEIKKFELPIPDVNIAQTHARLIMLLRASTIINNMNDKGDTLLTWVVDQKMSAFVEFLLKYSKGVSIEARNRDGYSPLMLAALNGDVSTVKILLNNNADVNTRNNDAQTPLMNAVLGGQPEIVALILEKVTDINAQDDQGDTALLLAVLAKKPTIVAMLLEKGADLSIANKEGQDCFDAPTSDAVRTMMEVKGHKRARIFRF